MLSLVNIGRCTSSSLRSLSFDNVFRMGHAILENDAFLALAEGCENLVELNVPKGNPSPTALQYLSGFCSNLKTISLGSCRDLTDDSLVSLGQGCPQLER